MNQQRPLFSIITPTYNRAGFLPETVASVKAQTFTDYEHIIIDDGSSDNTFGLIGKLAQSDPKIVYRHQTHKGRSRARNAGISIAEGKYVCFLDSDDLWLPNHLEELSHVCKADESIGFIHTGLIWFYQDGTTERPLEIKPRSGFTSDVEYVIANQLAPDCVCIRRDILNTYQFLPDHHINEDIELWAKVAVNYPVLEIKTHTAKLRVHTGNTINMVDDVFKPQKDILISLAENPLVRESLSRRFINLRLKGLRRQRINAMRKDNNRLRLIFYLVGFLLRYPFHDRYLADMVLVLKAVIGKDVSR